MLLLLQCRFTSTETITVYQGRSLQLSHSSCALRMLPAFSQNSRLELHRPKALEYSVYCFPKQYAHVLHLRCNGTRPATELSNEVRLYARTDRLKLICQSGGGERSLSTSHNSHNTDVHVNASPTESVNACKLFLMTSKRHASLVQNILGK